MTKLIKVAFDYYGEFKEELNKITYLQQMISTTQHYVVELSPLYAEIILNEDFRQIKTIVRRLKLDKINEGVISDNKNVIFLEFFLREYDKISLFTRLGC